jgi:ABC-type long-subunit fatty acid transport system fused permease/ATPase subunit
MTELLTDQLADERARKASIEARGMAVITTAGTLVTITLGFVALAARDAKTVLAQAVVILLVASLVGLVAAAVMGLLVNLPARVPQVDAAYLLAGEDDQDVAIRVELLTGLRALNRVRARLLFAALSVEVVALVVMAVAVTVALSPML